MCGTAAAASTLLTVTRTSSEPARASSATCRTVAATSAVSVLVIDWTTMGAAPPIVDRPDRDGNAAAALARAIFRIAVHWSVSRATSTLVWSGEIDGLLVVGEPHAMRVADHDGERRAAVYALLGARRIQLREDRLAAAIADLHPRRLLEHHAHLALARSGAGSSSRAALCAATVPLRRAGRPCAGASGAGRRTADAPTRRDPAAGRAAGTAGAPRLLRGDGGDGAAASLTRAPCAVGKNSYAASAATMTASATA